MRQITERGYQFAEVSQRLGVSQHSLYKWKKKFAASNTKSNGEVEAIRRLKKELARVMPRMQSEVRVHRLQFSVRTMCSLLRVHPSRF